MSERELRRVLSEVIEDIDCGRLRAPARRRCWSGLGGAVGGGALAVSVALGGCMAGPAYGVPPVEDGQVSQDAGAQDAEVDGGPVMEYAVPFDAEVDGGPVLEYGGPFDAGAEDGGAAEDAEVDGGPVVDYGVPFDGGY